MVERTGIRGGEHGSSRNASRNGARAGSMYREWNAAPIGNRRASAPNFSAALTVRSTASRSPAITNLPGALMLVSITRSPASSRIASRCSSEQIRLAIPSAGPPEAMICSAARMRASTTFSAVSTSQTPATASAEISPKLCPIITSGRTPRVSSTRAIPSSTANSAV